MIAPKYLHLRGFGLGAFEQAPWRNYGQEPDQYWNLEESNFVDQELIEPLLCSTAPSGFIQTFQFGHVFALFRLEGEVFLTASISGRTHNVCLFSDRKQVAIVAVFRGFFRGMFSLVERDTPILNYSYQLHRLAEFVADPLVKDRLDFFQYIRDQQRIQFIDFLTLFPANDKA